MFKKHRVAIVAIAAVAIVGGGVSIALAQSSGTQPFSPQNNDVPATPMATLGATQPPIADGDNNDPGTPSPQAEPSPGQTAGNGQDESTGTTPQGSGDGDTPDTGTVTPQAGTPEEALGSTSASVHADARGNNSENAYPDAESLGALALDLANPQTDVAKRSGLTNVYSASVNSEAEVVYVAVASESDVPPSAHRGDDGNFQMTISGATVVIVTGTQYPSDQ